MKVVTVFILVLCYLRGISIFFLEDGASVFFSVALGLFWEVFGFTGEAVELCFSTVRNLWIIWKIIIKVRCI